MKLIKNARIITMEDKEYKNGYLIIDEGKIHDIGDMPDLNEEESKFSFIWSYI